MTIMAPSRRGQVLVAVATPFAADDTVRSDLLLEHCRWLLEHGSDGLVLFGTTGEAQSLTREERMGVLESLLKAGLPSGQLVVGTGCCALDDTIALTRHAIGHGCTQTLLHPPFFFKDVTELGVVEWFDRVIAGAGDPRLRLTLYHFPSMTGVAITRDIVAELVRRHPDVVVGYKDSSGEFDHAKAICAEFPSLAVYAGLEPRLTNLLEIGGAGVISGSANVQPASIRRLVDSQGTPTAATEQRRVDSVTAALSRRGFFPSVKSAVASLHGQPDWRRMRLPLRGLEPAHEHALLDELIRLGAL